MDIGIVWDNENSIGDISCFAKPGIQRLTLEAFGAIA
jgi:hypothetical protein